MQFVRLFSITALVLSSIALFSTTARAGELSGRWRSGEWTDDNTGHRGPLKARFREKSNGDYRVVYTGRFALVVPFRFATTMNVVGRDGDKVLLAGESRLPGFGQFTYQAVADEDNFNSQYSSRRWRGEFNLNR